MCIRLATAPVACVIPEAVGYPRPAFAASGRGRCASVCGELNEMHQGEETVHLVLSAFIALLYAAGFEYATHRAGAVVGLGFSVLHIALYGAVSHATASAEPALRRG